MSAGVCASSHVASASISGMSLVFEPCHRSVQPRICRVTKPAGFPSASSPFATTSMACRSASVSMTLPLMRPRSSTSPAIGGGSSVRMVMPRRRSMT
ncbi:hypothetical protein D3C83_91640 [compost metagenome]